MEDGAADEVRVRGYGGDAVAERDPRRECAYVDLADDGDILPIDG